MKQKGTKRVSEIIKDSQRQEYSALKETNKQTKIHQPGNFPEESIKSWNVKNGNMK